MKMIEVDIPNEQYKGLRSPSTLNRIYAQAVEAGLIQDGEPLPKIVDMGEYTRPDGSTVNVEAKFADKK